MKINKIIKLCCFILLVGCSLTKSQLHESSQDPHILIFEKYGRDFNNFQTKLIELQAFSLEEDALNKKILLQEKLNEVRLAYKKVEFIFDYLEPSYVYLYVNGGPLPKLHKEVAEIDIIPPNGLQRLDELVYQDESPEQYEEFVLRTKELLTAINFIKESHLGDTISRQNSIEFLRSGMVRVFTLGLTGFDTPGSGNGIQESIVSIKSMRDAFSLYRSDLDTEKRYIFNKILSLYERGLTQLESSNDFNSFDRLSFLKRVVNPIYRELFHFQKSLKIDNRPLNVHAQNYNSENLFDDDFLDLNYYSQFTFNDITNKASIDLGKTLFYDPILSNDLDLSCSSCHKPELGFTDGKAKSRTNRFGTFTKRNAPTLIDAGYTTKFFWDMREHDLEKQVTHVVEDSLEFNIDFIKIAKRLQQSEEYVEMFEHAYGEISREPINQRSISNAIAAYVNTLTSFNSAFDQYVKGEIDNISESSKKGFNLFMGKAACGTCHFAPVFNGAVPPFYIDAESEVLGVTEGYNPKNPVFDKDIGRSGNGRKGDAHPHFDHSFKTVTVRNIALTAPYMHNGLFETLDDVIDFYNDGGGVGMGLEIENQTLAGDSLNLNESEKAQLIDFLHILTDTTGLIPGKIELPKFKNQPYWNERGRPIVID